MKQTQIVVILVSVLVLGFTVPMGAADGKAAFLEAKCEMCHAVGAADIAAKVKSGKMKGPDLSGFKTDDMAATIAYVTQKAAGEDGKKHLKGFKGSDEELQTILDWLGSLEAQQ